MTVQQVEQYFDQVMLYQAQSQLGLTDDQFLRFGAGLGKLQAARRQQQRRRALMLRELNMLLNATADEAAITAKLKELDDAVAANDRAVQDAYAAIDQVLDLRQRARFRVFEEMMERRKLDLLSRARRLGAPPAGRSAPPQ
jgi:Spy/CpxP family protein refolding chaperone